MLKRKEQIMGEPDMANAQTNESNQPKPLRLWPGVVVAGLQWLIMLVVPIVAPVAAISAVLGGAGLGLAVVVWWLFFSRAPWAERVGAIVFMVVALVATKRVVHESIAGAGMGMLLFIYAIPVLSLALVAAVVASRRLSSWPRRATIVVSILVACGVFTLLRTGGITGEAVSDLHWRWTKTPEERLLAQAGDQPNALPVASVTAETPEKRPVVQTGDEPAALPAAPAAEKIHDERPAAQTNNEPVAPAASETGADWPGFRGPERNSIIRGVRIETNWSASPPVELWRRPIGPAWSSFAVRGHLFYTQEQRGESEIVACYNVTTGEPVWMHSDSVRFWESNAGAGPRGTPTLSNGRVYTFGGTGILNVLNVSDGSVVWSRSAASDAEVKVPIWGFASSPLVVDSVVIVAAAGRLVGYDLATGDPRWFGPKGGWGYSSPQLATIDGVTQILLLNGEGAISVAPADGTRLWKHEWESDGIVQPAVIAGSDVLIGSGSGGEEVGMRRIAVVQ